jgi:hypothetical protein
MIQRLIVFYTYYVYISIILECAEKLSEIDEEKLDFFVDTSHLGIVVVSAHTNPTHAHHTHTTRTQTTLQLYSDHIASFVRSPVYPWLHRRRAHRTPFVALRVRGN